MRRSILTSALSVVFLALAGAAALTQTATVSGSLSNFDVVNDTGRDAHGFEIQLEGLQPKKVSPRRGDGERDNHSPSPLRGEIIFIVHDPAAAPRARAVALAFRLAIG